MSEAKIGWIVIVSALLVGALGGFWYGEHRMARWCAMPPPVACEDSVLRYGYITTGDGRACGNGSHLEIVNTGRDEVIVLCVCPTNDHRIPLVLENVHQ